MILGSLLYFFFGHLAQEQAMSLWSNLASWAVNTAKTETQQHGAQAVQALSAQITKVIDDHAADLGPQLQPLAGALVQGLVAAVMTKAK